MSAIALARFVAAATSCGDQSRDQDEEKKEGAP
jgi:hypothetical protein